MIAAALLLLLGLPRPYADWPEMLDAAQRAQKPLVIFFRPELCERCDAFERVTLPHPTIQRRLPAVAFATMLADEPSVALYDHTGALRVRWRFLPDTMNFGIILDTITAVSNDFECAVQLGPGAGDLAAGRALARIGRMSDARAALARAREHGNAETRQNAIVTEAILDANEGRRAEAVSALGNVIPVAATSMIAREAQTALDAIHHLEMPAPPAGVIRILPLGRHLVIGRLPVRTSIGSANVARVTFSVDGRELARVARPPFSSTIDFGALPERHAIRVVAFDAKGRTLGRDERVVNEAGEAFWLRVAEPLEGPAAGSVRVVMNTRVPAGRRLRRITLSWNDAERAVVEEAPWETNVRIVPGQLGVLRAVAELDDGRTSEDAVLLNAVGAAGRADVQLVELPLTIPDAANIAPEDVIVREGNVVRRVESIATAAETPLTVGMLFDVSDSMQATLPDLQEAAIRFLDASLEGRDRAFAVTFDTRARLVTPATSDKAALRKQILRFRPDGLTALYDAMVLGLLQFEGVKGRRAMIVFTDGLDIVSRYRAGDVAELARRMNVPVHLIAASGAVDRDLLRIAQASGGTAQTLHSLTELPGIYARIEAALRAQILAFIRTDPPARENEWRDVQVQVLGHAEGVHAPSGYYSTW